MGSELAAHQTLGEKPGGCPPFLASTMNAKQRKSILHKYLGFCPALFDVRKKEILKDNLDIGQWQINMNFLIYKYGTIASSEKTTFDCFADTFKTADINEIAFRDYLEEKVTPVLLNISEVDLDLPRLLCAGKDRNWFLAGYPDVFEYFYVQPKLPAGEFGREIRQDEVHVRAVAADRERMEHYAARGKGSQAIWLVRMKTFYKHELKKTFLLCR
jgi:hypothetical protein